MRISDWSSDVCSSDLLWSLFLSLVLMTTSRGSENHGEASRFFMYVEIRPFESAMPSIVTAPPDSLSEVRLTPSGRVLTISSKKCTVAERLADRKRVVWGQSVSVSVNIGGRGTIKKKNKKK